MEVDAIEERAREALPVALDRAGAASAFAGARIEPAARAEVSRGDEQNEHVGERVGRDGALGGQDREGDRQIESASPACEDRRARG